MFIIKTTIGDYEKTYLMPTGLDKNKEIFFILDGNENPTLILSSSQASDLVAQGLYSLLDFTHDVIN